MVVRRSVQRGLAEDLWRRQHVGNCMDPRGIEDPGVRKVRCGTNCGRIGRVWKLSGWLAVLAQRVGGQSDKLRRIWIGCSPSPYEWVGGHSV